MQHRIMLCLALIIGLFWLIPSAQATTASAVVQLDLSGTWRFTRTDNLAYANPATPTDGPEWSDIQAPQEWAAAGYGSYDGFAWYKRQFVVPATFEGTPLIAVMGYIDDADEVFFNGVKIGATGAMPPAFQSDWYTLRQYPIPAELIGFGATNTIAIRMYDGTGGGGIHKGPFGLFSKGALRAALGVEAGPASPEAAQAVMTTLATQRAALLAKDIPAFLATLDAGFVHDGRDRARLEEELRGWADQYTALELQDEEVEVLAQEGQLLVDTTRTVLGVKGDGSREVLVPRSLSYRFFQTMGSGLREVGNHSRFFEDAFDSTLLGERRTLTVYLPPSYYRDPTRRFATVYLLHGFNGHNREWMFREIHTVLDRLIGNGLIAETIVVMPDGDNAWYLNAYDGSFPYRDFFATELVPFIDATYRTRPQADQRGITGVSMGGFGAFSMGLRHRELFASIGSHMGALNLPPLSCNYGEPMEAAYCNEQIPTNMVALRTPAELQAFDFYFDAGTEDDFGFFAAATQMDGLLTAKLAEHSWYLGPGKHNDAFWLPQLHRSLGMHMRVAGDTPPPPCYDFNGSGSVDLGDLQRIAGLWGDAARYDVRYDLAPNRAIDLQDLLPVADAWEQACEIGGR